MDIDFNNIDSSRIFLYVVVTIIIFYIISKVDVRLNTILGAILCIIIITNINSYTEKENMIANNTLKIKSNLITPSPKNSANYDKVIDFLFSIQDMYMYNPQAYVDMVNHIEFL